jgi:transketolase
MASGSEVGLILEAGKRLASESISNRVISFPSWELFELSGKKYQDSVLTPEVTKRLAVEMGVPQGWEKWVGPNGRILGIEGFGASAPYKTLLEKYGFTVDNIVRIVKNLLNVENK